MDLNLVTINKLCQGEPMALAEQLTQWGLIPNEGAYMCSRCKSPLRLQYTNKRADRLRWMCESLGKPGPRKRQRCPGWAEFRAGTIFQNSRLSIFQILGFINLWVDSCPLIIICEQLKIALPTATDWGSFCRKLVFDSYMVLTEKLGGNGKIVEIDESKFGELHEHYVEAQCVFGCYERGTGKVFMELIPDRFVNTLHPIIRDRIEEGTTIISDYWKVYGCLKLQPYEELRVNRSLTFKDPDAGTNTNVTETSWQASKSIFSTNGRNKSHVPGNLARYLFQKRCTELNLNRTTEFLRLAALLYNGSEPRQFADNDATDDAG